MSYKIRNFGLLGGEAKGGASVRLYSYLLDKDEDYNNLLQQGYFNTERNRLLPNDVIMILTPDKKDKLGYLLVKKITLDNVEVENIDLGSKSDLLPLPDSDTGSAGISDLLSRYDHQHPKVIATEKDRGQIIIANNNEVLTGSNDTKAITSLKLQNKIKNIKATDIEIKEGADVYKYTTPKQMRVEIDNVVNSNYLNAFWFGKTTTDFKVPLPTDVRQNYFDFTNNKIFIANNDLSGWTESKTIEPKNGSKVGISNEFWDTIEKGFSGFAIYSKDNAKWDYYPDKTLKYDNETIVPRESDGALKVADDIVSGRYLLEPVWSPRILENESYLRSDTFDWYNGIKYKQAYNHILADTQNKTPTSEVVAGITINCILADDGDKIILANDTETLANLETLYTNTGIAWYYILDTVNTRFKLPRTQWNFVGLRPNGNVGEYVEESLPNITGEFSATAYMHDMALNGSFYDKGGEGGSVGSTDGAWKRFYGFSASRSSSTYQDGASVQQRANQMILYFYVGGKEEKVSIIEDYKINNTVPLTCPVYAPNMFEDINYLLSDNQWHSGEIYNSEDPNVKSLWRLLTSEYNNENSIEITKTLSDGTSLTLKKTPLDYLICKVDENNTEEKINRFYNEIKFTCWVINTTTNEFKLPQNTKRELVENWKDGNGNWYSLYSDGWVEQGGHVENVREDTTTVVKLFVVMKDGNYSPTLSNHRNASNVAGYAFIRTLPTSTIMNLKCSAVGATVDRVFWTVKGYANTSALNNQFNFSNYLYFKVGNTTVGAELVYANKTLEKLDKKANLSLDNINDTAKQNIKSFNSPDWSRAETINVAAMNVNDTYTFNEDGILYIYLLSGSSNGFVSFKSSLDSSQQTSTYIVSITKDNTIALEYRVQKGEVITLKQKQYSTINVLFLPLK